VRTAVVALAIMALAGGASSAQEPPDIAPLRAAAGRGDAAAQNELGLLLAEGRGVKQDFAAARALFEASTAQGDRVGQYRLALIYDRGDGVPQDFRRAVDLYRLSVAQGYAPAQNNLANMYAAGHGVPEDHVEAVRLYRLAATQGDRAAQDNLGNAYAGGLGVPIDYLRAYLWLTVAFEGGLSRSVTNREGVAALLTAGERARMDKQAAACRTSSFKDCWEPPQ
jgi:TPR repeat protein